MHQPQEDIFGNKARRGFGMAPWLRVVLPLAGAGPGGARSRSTSRPWCVSFASGELPKMPRARPGLGSGGCGEGEKGAKGGERDELMLARLRGLCSNDKWKLPREKETGRNAGRGWEGLASLLASLGGLPDDCSPLNRHAADLDRRGHSQGCGEAK